MGPETLYRRQNPQEYVQIYSTPVERYLAFAASVNTAGYPNTAGKNGGAARRFSICTATWGYTEKPIKVSGLMIGASAAPVTTTDYEARFAIFGAQNGANNWFWDDNSSGKGLPSTQVGNLAIATAVPFTTAMVNYLGGAGTARGLRYNFDQADWIPQGAFWILGLWEVRGTGGVADTNPSDAFYGQGTDKPYLWPNADGGAAQSRNMVYDTLFGDGTANDDINDILFSTFNNKTNTQWLTSASASFSITVPGAFTVGCINHNFTHHLLVQDTRSQ